MKVIYVEPGHNISQALSNAYFALKDEPITLCANGMRVIFMKDEREEIEPIEVPSPLIVTCEPNQEYARKLDSSVQLNKEEEKK